MSLYRLEYSKDGEHWRQVQERHYAPDAPGSGRRRRQVTRDRLQDIQREAEFHSHRYPHVRIVFPEPPQ